MFKAEILELLSAVESGEVDIEAAAARLKNLPFADLGFAKVDHHRTERLGFPEVIYCAGKTPRQIGEIAKELLENAPVLLATRADSEAFDAIQEIAPDALYQADARLVVVDRRTRKEAAGFIAVACAGTADLPVAEEAALTAELMGARVARLVDVGVAGLHRLLSFRKELEKARVVVAVAGMDGVLPTVIGGLVSCPVVAVPTSVGYGAGAGGIAPLLTMLNSCAPGVSVVNIDNGFGAGYLAALINRTGEADE